MEYKVKLTEGFIKEVNDICAYICFELKNLEASNKLRNRIMDSIRLLNNSPKMFKEIEKIDSTERCYR